MAFYERQGRGDQDRERRERERHRWQKRLYGDEDFDSDGEDWREPMEFEPRSGRLQWAGESLDRGHHPPPPGPFYGKGPKGYRRSDQRILEDVSQALQDCGELDASEIEVACQEGEVALKGSVDDRRAKRIAEGIAEQQPGVRDVRNEIRIAWNGPRANAEK